MPSSRIPGAATEAPWRPSTGRVVAVLSSVASPSAARGRSGGPGTVQQGAACHPSTLSPEPWRRTESEPGRKGDVIELGEWAKIRRLHRAEGVNDGHTVTLTGMVGSNAAMREVVDAAWKAPGVNRVRRPSRRRGQERPGVAPHGERAARFAARRGGARTLRVDGHPLPSDAGTPRRSANALG
jgi:hypothetical protein